MSDENKNLVAEGIGAIVLLILSPFFALYRGWALWVLWGWFAPLAWGPLPWLNAVGICIIAGFLFTRAAGKAITLAVVYPALCVGIAGLLHLCGVRGV